MTMTLTFEFLTIKISSCLSPRGFFGEFEISHAQEWDKWMEVHWVQTERQ